MALRKKQPDADGSNSDRPSHYRPESGDPRGISVVVSTLGRSTLAAAIDPLLPQLRGSDEVILVFDGPRYFVPVDTEGVIADSWADHPQVHEIRLPRRADDYGCTPKDIGHTYAINPFIWYLDDDDIPADDALDTIRKHADPYRTTMFSMRRGHRMHKFERGNIGLPAFVFPNDRAPSYKRIWRERGGLSVDFDYVLASLDPGQQPHKHDEIIVTIPSQSFSRTF